MSSLRAPSREVIRHARLLVTIPQELNATDIARLASAVDELIVVRCATAREVSDAVRMHPRANCLLTTAAPDAVPVNSGLQWAQLASSGIEHTRDSPLWDLSGVVVTNASGVYTKAIAEWVILAILWRTHQAAQFARFHHHRRWPVGAEIEGSRSRSLAGRTVGIIGFGSIGREVSRLAIALGLEVLATTPTRAIEPDATSTSVTFVDRENLPHVLRESDFVCLSAPATRGTRRMIGGPELRLMRPDAMLINIARGAHVDEAALAAHLRSSPEFFAALDVFSEEPLPPTSPLFDHENVLLSPHVSGVAVGNDSYLIDLVVRNADNFRSGAPMTNAVDAPY